MKSTDRGALLRHYERIAKDRLERAARLRDTDPYAAALFQHTGGEALQAARRLFPMDDGKCPHGHDPSQCATCKAADKEGSPPPLGPSPWK